VGFSTGVGYLGPTAKDVVFCTISLETGTPPVSLEVTPISTSTVHRRLGRVVWLFTVAAAACLVR